MSTLLSFISDADLKLHTETLLTSVERARNSIADNPYRNVIDPFSALFGVAVQGIHNSEWMNQEISRQMQKSLQNAIGDCHQNIIGSINGWQNKHRDEGYDVINTQMKIIAEIKNKYNTVNSRSALSVYNNLEQHLAYTFRRQGYVAYVVVIVPNTSKPYTKPFKASVQGTSKPARQDISEIDGRSFYRLATGGIPDALDQLYMVLPQVLSSIFNIPSSDLQSQFFSDLFNRVYGQ